MLSVSLKSFLSKLLWKQRNAGRIFVASSAGDPEPEPDPDPHVFGPSGSISQRYGSGSGSGYGSGSFYFLINVLSGLK
jgi:hypothetical protein